MLKAYYSFSPISQEYFWDSGFHCGSSEKGRDVSACISSCTTETDSHLFRFPSSSLRVRPCFFVRLRAVNRLDKGDRLIYSLKVRALIRHRITKLPASKKASKNNARNWTVLLYCSYSQNTPEDWRGFAPCSEPRKLDKMTNNRKHLTWRVKALVPIFYALLRSGLSFSGVTLD